MDIGGLVEADRNVEGVVEMMLDATQNYAQPLTAERLFGWHAALFPTGRSGMSRITVGAWRTAEAGPMQVVSGPIGRERVQARIAALLNEKDAATRFKTLFDLRSQFVHGRAGVGCIGSDQRVEARRLARRVSAALVDRASRDPRPREEILAELLVAGMAMRMS